MALLAPRVRPGARLPLRRRGGPGRRSRTWSRWARARATSCCSAIRCSSGSRCRACTRGARATRALEYLLDGTATISARPRHLPRRDVAHAPGRLPVHLGGGVRRAAAARSRAMREPAARAGHRTRTRRCGRRACSFVPVAHDGCTQRSDEEAARVASALPESRSASATSTGTARSTRWARRTSSSSRRTTCR